MDSKRLGEIKARAAAATPAPADGGKEYIEITKEVFGDLPNFINDTVFGAHARADVLALVGEVERLQSGITELVNGWRLYANEAAFQIGPAQTMATCAKELEDLLNRVA